MISKGKTIGRRLLAGILAAAVLLMLTLPARAEGTKDTKIYDMQVNSMTNPLGLDETPVFSWKMSSSQRGQKQAACQITVKNGNATVWDSGRLETDASVNISYRGPALTAQTRYDWTVTIWDQDGAVFTNTDWFETGFLDGDKGFADASWIRLPETEPYTGSEYHYTLDYVFSLDDPHGEWPTAFNALFGGDADGQNYYMWQLSTSGGGQLKPHQCTDGSTSAIATRQIDLEAGKKYALRIEINGTEVNTYLAEYQKGQTLDAADQIDSRDLTESPALGKIGFSGWSGNEEFYVYEVTVTDGTGEQVFHTDFDDQTANPFGNDQSSIVSTDSTDQDHKYRLHVQTGPVWQTRQDSYLPADGGEGSTAADSSTSTAGTPAQNTETALGVGLVSAEDVLFPVAEEPAAQGYIIDYEFEIEHGGFAPIFGAESASKFYYWDLNDYYDQLLQTRKDIWREEKQYNVTIESGKPYSMRIEVRDGTVKTYLKEKNAADYGEPAASYTADENDILTSWKKLGFRAWDGGAEGEAERADRYESYYVDSVKVTDLNGTELFCYNAATDENPWPDAEVKDGRLYITGQEKTAEILPSSVNDPDYGVVRPIGQAPVYGTYTSGETPRFRKEFSASNAVSSARLYATAAGIYDVWINGQKVSNDYFDPGNSEYDDVLYYQTFDVTDLLQQGQNAIAVELGTGWYAGAEFQHIAKYYGTTPAFLGKLVITYADGTKECVNTDESWLCTTDGPLKYQNLYQGETYDARDELTGWDMPNYTANHGDTWVQAAATNKIKLNLGEIKAQATPTIQAESTAPAAKLISTFTSAEDPAHIPTGKQAFLYDFGQNFAGNVKITLHNVEPGTQIRVRHGEILNDKVTNGNDGPVGTLHTKNYADTDAVILYTAKGGENETYTPSKFHTGFRYIEITGLTNPDQVTVEGVVLHTAMDITSTFVSSNADVNKLWSNTTWSQRSNFMSVPTDCPQRSERLGWSADIGVFARTSTFNADDEAFLVKWLADAQACQTTDGRYSDIAPRGTDFYFGAGTGGWAEGPVIVAYELFKQFGNTQVIEQYYDSMKKYADFLKTTIDSDGLSDRTKYGTFGDWCALEKCEIQLTDTAYAAYTMLMMKDMATAIGKTEDAAEYQAQYDALRTAWQNYYLVKQNGDFTGEIRDDRLRAGYEGDTSVNKSNSQTAYVLGLVFDLIPQEVRTAAADYLVKDIQDHENHLTTGFLGVSWLNQALVDTGHADVAYTLLEQDTYPSWLFPVKAGATTIWELWNSYTTTEGINTDGMNSYNHYSYGSICSWLYQSALGIQRQGALGKTAAGDAAAYKSFTLAPAIGGSFTSMSGSFESPYGTIASGWEKPENGGAESWTRYTATVPANTTATLYLPLEEGMTILEGGKDAKQVEGITFVKNEDGKAVYTLASGTYEFTKAKAEDTGVIPTAAPTAAPTARPTATPNTTAESSVSTAAPTEKANGATKAESGSRDPAKTDAEDQKNPSIPQTGDEAPLAMYLFLLLAAAFGMATVLYKKRKGGN